MVMESLNIDCSLSPVEILRFGRPSWMCQIYLGDGYGLRGAFSPLSPHRYKTLPPPPWYM